MIRVECIHWYWFLRCSTRRSTRWSAASNPFDQYLSMSLRRSLWLSPSYVHSLTQWRWLTIDASLQWIDSILCAFISHSATQAKTKERTERQELISDRSPDNYFDVVQNVFVLQEHVDKRTRAEYTRNVHQSSCWQVERLISRAMQKANSSWYP